MNEDDYWLEVTDQPDYIERFFDDPMVDTIDTFRAIIEAFPEHPQSILEIGCGYGRLTSLVKDKYPNSVVVGTDINPKIIEIAEGDAIYRVTDTFEGNWDAIYSVTVFQHLPDGKKRDYIMRAGKHLNNGGVLRIQFIEGERNNFVDHWVSIEKMESWFNRAGLKITRVEKLVHPEWTWITGVK